jgi:hypothetical protein
MSKHHQRIHVAVRWMSEGERESSNDLEAERLPKAYRSFVAAHDEIELHRSVPPRSSVIERVLAHQPRDTPPSRGRARHVGTVANVCATAGLIWSHVVRTKDRAIFLSNENFLVGSEPVGQGVGFAHFRIKRVRLARPDGWPDD